MSIFSDSDLQTFSDLAVDLAMKDTCDIERAVRVPDGQRGFRETREVVNTVPCFMLNESTPRLEDIAQQHLARNEFQFYLPLGTVLRQDDWLIYKGNRYEIIDIKAPMSYTVFVEAFTKLKETGV